MEFNVNISKPLPPCISSGLVFLSPVCPDFRLLIAADPAGQSDIN